MIQGQAFQNNTSNPLCIQYVSVAAAGFDGAVLDCYSISQNLNEVFLVVCTSCKSISCRNGMIVQIQSYSFSCNVQLFSELNILGQSNGLIYYGRRSCERFLQAFISFSTNSSNIVIAGAIVDGDIISSNIAGYCGIFNLYSCRARCHISIYFYFRKFKTGTIWTILKVDITVDSCIFRVDSNFLVSCFIYSNCISTIRCLYGSSININSYLSVLRACINCSISHIAGSITSISSIATTCARYSSSININSSSICRDASCSAARNRTIINGQSSLLRVINRIVRCRGQSSSINCNCRS